MKPIHSLALSVSCALALAVPTSVMAKPSGEEILNNQCATCHIKDSDGKYARIDGVRKTPEAWDMTVVRMMRNHRVALKADERTAIVRYLAETRGLSLSETEGRRYILEKEPVATDEAPNELLAQTCGRCHSFARVALQRRTPDEWEKLINFHLGQFPSLEIQALARDRDWWGIANNEVVPALAEMFPYKTAPAVTTEDLSGNWVVAGHTPGRGDYSGLMALEASGDEYAITLNLNYADTAETYTGRGILLGQAEWRATLTNGETTLRQVLALDSEGNLTGRWFEKGNDPIGGRIHAAPEDSEAQILAVSPTYLKSGQTASIKITGVNLTGEISLPEGLEGEVVSRSENEIILSVSSADALGETELSIGSTTTGFVVYDNLDRIGVEPNVTISRVGGNGGPIPKVPAQFAAVGYLNGPDGEAETDDDIRVGYFPATWSVDNWNEVAASMNDAKYAGSIDQNGRFTPAGAGPNPERFMSANNIGDLKVTAVVNDGSESLSGDAHLYATVQRFVDPPIR